jgi:hypothetical protein
MFTHGLPCLNSRGGWIGEGASGYRQKRAAVRLGVARLPAVAQVDDVQEAGAAQAFPDG